MNDRSALSVTQQELEEFLSRMRLTVSEKDYEIVDALVRTVREMGVLLGNNRTSIDRLKQLVFGPRTERRKDVLPKSKEDGQTASNATSGKKKRKKVENGHGRNGAADYSGATRIPVPHTSVHIGDSCPECIKGKCYDIDAGKVIRVKGQSFFEAKVYEPQRLRCNLCGEVFTADLPAEAGTKKYDETVGSMLSVLKYGTGFPFNRIESHQHDQGVPMPASVQWEIVRDVADTCVPVRDELLQQASRGDVIHNDDTTAKILGLTREREEKRRESGNTSLDKERTGIFTTGIVATGDGHEIALFFTGKNHAGENLTELLRRRPPEAAPPIQMCDALNRNYPDEFQTFVANCLAHARRKFVDETPRFPDECKFVLDSLAEVYRNDALAKAQGLSPKERLLYHQANSTKIMDDLKAWLDAQFSEKLVEPNSSLGKAIAYMRNHWGPLTLFLQMPGAPLDNNLCERVLKMAILHRKNALFYMTERGAAVGDLLMSIIFTCRLCAVNAFEYLTELLRHPKQMTENPAAWMPWNYKTALAAITEPIPGSAVVSDGHSPSRDGP
jgi:hypothetical protein